MRARVTPSGVNAGAAAPGCELHSAEAPRERCLMATAAGTEGGA
jgi:hypothetical protein